MSLLIPSLLACACNPIALASQPKAAHMSMQLNLLRREHSKDDCCSELATRYTPSLLEQMANPFNGKAACNDEMVELAQVWLEEIAAIKIKDARVFSQICVPGQCEAQLLEPLAWNMQDPRLTCNLKPWPNWSKQYEIDHNQLSFLSKEFIALPPDNSLTKRGRVLLYDLGASLYGNGCTYGWDCKANGKPEGWGTSGKWLVDEYGKRGINFDHMYLWEKFFTESQYRASGLPDELANKITFYHGTIDASDNAVSNPLNILRETCTQEDYCILKVDFDSPKDEVKITDAVAGEAIEQINLLFSQERANTMSAVSIADALLENKDSIRDLVDEFFMDTSTGDHKMDYHLFLKLRQSGVRAHMWV